MAVAWACRPFDLGQLALEQGPEVGDVPGRPAAPPNRSFPDGLLLAAGLGQQLHGLRPRLPDDHFGFPVRLLLGFGPQLLGGDERVVHRPFPVAEGPQLLLHVPQPLLPLQPLAQQPLDLFGHAQLEIVHLGAVVAPEAGRELLGPHIVRSQMKGVVGHVRSPNSRVPNRTIVAPSSTASR